MEYYQFTIRIPKRPLRLIQFRISTIMLLMAIVALGLGWRRDHKQLRGQLYQLENPAADWGTNQVTGPPDTTSAGDIRTAWASLTPDDSKEWLELEYDTSVVPSAIVIHETFNPGAVTKITHVPYWGKEKTLWEGTDPTPASASSGTSRIPVSAGIRTGHIKLYIDSKAVPGWNEIDAVGLEYGNNKVMWAMSAKASSSWGTRSSQLQRTPGMAWSF
jgi:hypothetical protein